MNRPNRSVSYLRRLVETWPSIRAMLYGQGQAPNLVRGTIIEASNIFRVSGSSGVSGTVTVLTALQDNGGTTEYKSRDLTFSGGIITAIGAESDWTAI